MENRETLVAAIAQTLAPMLFEISGDVPSEMGFPICDAKEDVDNRLARQFSPVEYWTERATEIAEGLATAFEAGGVDLSNFDYDKAADAFRAMRSDLSEDA